MTSPEMYPETPRQIRLQEVAALLANIATEFVQVRTQLDNEGNEPLANYYDDLVADITSAEIAAKSIIGFETDLNLKYINHQD